MQPDSGTVVGTRFCSLLIPRAVGLAFGKDVFLPKELCTRTSSPKAAGEAQHPAARAAGEAVWKNLLPILLNLVL